MEHEVRIEEYPQMILYGVSAQTNDRTLSKDIPRLSAEFHRITETKEGEVLPFFVLSRDYDEKSGNSELFIGSLNENEHAEKLVLPKGIYAVMTVRPKFGIMWGPAIGEAKRFFYTKWMPESDYIA